MTTFSPDSPAAGRNDFDAGPLSWVIGEIREALDRSASALKQAAEQDADVRPTSLQHAKTHLHQAHGALQIVDVDGVALLTGAAETVLDRIGAAPDAPPAEAVSAIADAYRALVEYLEDLLFGAPNQPVRLFPYYKALLAVAGEQRAHPAALFFPDLSAQPRFETAEAVSDAGGRPELRQRYERALLGLLKSADLQGESAHAREIADVIADVGRLQSTPRSKAFWWVMHGLADAVAAGQLPGQAAYAKQAFARINLQLRRFCAGAQEAPQDLLRDALFLLCLAPQPTPLGADIRRAYRLDGMVPADYELRRYGRVDMGALANARERLGHAKSMWNRIAGGDAHPAPAFETEMRALAEAGALLGSPALSKLLRELGGIARHAAYAKPGDALGLEIATTLLFVEHALNHITRLPDDFAERTDAMIARLLSVVAGEPSGTSAQWLEDMSRQAQQKQTMAVLCEEMLATLRQVEKALDTYFGNPEDGGMLPQICQALHQVGGALAVLDQDGAVRAVDHTRGILERLESAGAAPAGDVLQQVARNVGALGFFIEALERDPEQAGQRFVFDEAAGIFQASAVARQPAPEPDDEPVQAFPLSRHGDVSDDQQGPVVEDAGVARLPAAPTPDGEPGSSIPGADDAVPMTSSDALDSEVALPDGRAAEAQADLAWPEEVAGDAAPDPEAETLPAVAAETAIGPGAATAAAMRPSAAPPDTAPDDAVDAELLDIFLTEADEVLGCVRETLPALRAAPDSQTPLTTLRRSFHTLKGSSRMVALNAFGEAAWSIEQVLNLRLAGEPLDADALLPLIEAATGMLGAWVEDIRATGRSMRTPDALAEAAMRVKAGEPFRLDAPQSDERLAASADVVPDPFPPDAILPNAVAPGPDALVSDVLAEGAATGTDVASADAASCEDDLAALPAVEEIPLADADFALFGQAAPGAVLPATEDEAADAADAASDTMSEETPAVASRRSGDIIDFPMAAETARPDESIKRIGDIEISMPLHGIYLAETDELVRTLANDFAEWRHEPARPVAIASVHAAHSLAGSSATVGFDVLQQVAHRLETVLQQLAKRPVPLLARDLDTLDLAVERMRDMLRSFALGEMPSPRHNLVTTLSSLQKALALRADRDVVVLPGDDVVQQPPASAVRDAGAAPVLASDDAAGQAGIPLDPAAVVRDEIDHDLLPVFIEEGRDLLPQIGELLRVWRSRPADAAAPQALLRAMHTLKGSARMAGAMRLGQQIHEMEARIEQLMQAGSSSPQSIEDLLARHDYGLHLFEQLQNQPASVTPPAAADHAARALASLPADIVVAAVPAGAPQPVSAGDRAAPLPVPAAPLVRVRADILDRLVNQAGEVSISRSRLETGVGALQQSLGELTENVGRLRSQLREIEIQAETQISSRMTQAGDRGFDPLEFDRFTRLQELTRMMAESVNDVASVQQNIARTVEGATNDLLSQERLTRELQQDLMRVRMVQFGSIAERLYRVTRQTAKEVDKRVNLDIRGGSVELDRSVLERMTGPFEHLLRNAIAHGIEARAERRAASKQEAGDLLIEVRQEGNEVVIRFTDDGRGLDVERIRDKARAVGLLTDDREIADAEASELIFHPGFSTAAEVTELAGRGIGMDVVRSQAAALGGRVTVHSEAGRGAQFTIHLPLTLAVTQVVLLATGGKTYAVPSVLVEQVQQLKANPLASAYNDGAVLWQGHRVPLHYLSALLGDESAAPMAQQYSPVIVLRSGNDRLALHVDQVIGNREVVVKNIGPQLARMTGIAGATVLGSGDIVLILNPVPIAMRRVQQDLRAPRLLPADGVEDVGAVAETGAGDRQPAAAPVHGLRTQPIVMVVDDSLTVRRVTHRLLSREGYQAVLAKDGVDALEQLQAITPDVILLDIEMPRMDGFDLTRNLRDDERTRAIPIVMITSRTAAKHRNYALELGVNEYLGKPYREEELLRLIAGFVGRSASVA